MINKVIIIGSGPAGLTAGIYTSRAKLEPILFEGNQPGGQLTTTSKVENWPGIVEVFGSQLMMDMKKHAQHCGCQIISDNVVKVDFSSSPYKVFTQNGKEFETESVIIATGAAHKKLGIPGEKEYWSKGVSACATCDAPFFKDKNVIVVGGGNSAMIEAEFLSAFAKKVTIVHILDKFTANDPIKDKVLVNPKIEVLYSSTLSKVEGDEQKVTQVIIEDQKTKETSTLDADGVFIAIGMKPNTDVFMQHLEIDDYGYIVCKQKTQTSKEGVFAAGDVVDYVYQQAITASADGCKAALDCQEFLSKKS